MDQRLVQFVIQARKHTDAPLAQVYTGKWRALFCTFHVTKASTESRNFPFVVIHGYKLRRNLQSFTWY
jgi:hypothetical protein